jgi:hypothetical protein
MVPARNRCRLCGSGAPEGCGLERCVRLECLGFPTMPVGGQIACATGLCLVGGCLDGLSALPLVSTPAISVVESDDVDIGTSICVL